MKIAIDSGPTSGGHSWRGIGVNTLELTNGLFKFKNKSWTIDAFDFSSKNRLGFDGYDIVHLTSFNPYFVSIPFRKTDYKLVLTIHDLIPLIYPRNYASGLRGKIRFLINKFLINQNVDAILTISETSKKDIVRFLGVSPEIVHVVYLAPKSIFKKLETGNWKLEIKNRYGLPDRFVLYVGDVNYNKNVLRLIKACKILKIPLVICGKQAAEIESRININELNGPMDYFRYLFGRLHPEISHYKDLVGVASGVTRLGFVPDTDLVGVFNLASVYVQPSLYEGFGLPVLEAMATGTPVVASKIQVLVEIAGDAAIYSDPKSSHDMAQKIKIILNDQKLRNLLVKKGVALSKEFSWEKTSRGVIQVYQNLK
jgi:glycosyltransferase involved in cell wall biosynthesis